MSAIKRRQFLRNTLAALPAAALPYGRLFAAAESLAANDIEAVTGDGRQIVLQAADVRDFAASLRGELLLRESAGYDGARRAWNGAFDRHPAMIARCTGAAPRQRGSNDACTLMRPRRGVARMVSVRMRP